MHYHHHTDYLKKPSIQCKVKDILTHADARFALSGLAPTKFAFSIQNHEIQLLEGKDGKLSFSCV